MKFRSPTEQPIYMALTSGHTFVVGPELIEVPKLFHRQAVMEGCIPEGMDSLPKDDDTPSATKQSMIEAAMRKMVAEANTDDFTNDGKPDTRKLSARVGFTVLKEERDAAWEVVGED
ncbi:hypothetical protein [Methylibium sp.]|uniref:hypothetical protein n=1 Tax=Methylibium sp. TaxID=2067992 RepID=UPI003D118BCE